MPFNLDPKTLASLTEVNKFIQTWQFITFCSALNCQRKIAEIEKQITLEGNSLKAAALNKQLNDLKACQQAYTNLYFNMLNAPQNVNAPKVDEISEPSLQPNQTQIDTNVALNSRLNLITKELELMQEYAEVYKKLKSPFLLER